MKMQLDKTKVKDFFNKNKNRLFKKTMLVKKFKTPGRQPVVLVFDQAEAMIKNDDYYMEVE